MLLSLFRDMISPGTEELQIYIQVHMQSISIPDTRTVAWSFWLLIDTNEERNVTRLCLMTRKHRTRLARVKALKEPRGQYTLKNPQGY